MNLIIKFSLFQVCSATLTFYMWPLFEGRASFTLMSNISDEDMKVYKWHKYFLKHLQATVILNRSSLPAEAFDANCSKRCTLTLTFTHSFIFFFRIIWKHLMVLSRLLWDHEDTSFLCGPAHHIHSFIHSCRQNAHVIIWILFLTALSLVYWSRDSTN